MLWQPSGYRALTYAMFVAGVPSVDNSQGRLLVAGEGHGGCLGEPVFRARVPREGRAAFKDLELCRVMRYAWKPFKTSWCALLLNE